MKEINENKVLKNTVDTVFKVIEKGRGIISNIEENESIKKESIDALYDTLLCIEECMIEVAKI